jgi:uncharacterized membrane protein YbhN (UPF0104 family)
MTAIPTEPVPRPAHPARRYVLLAVKVVVTSLALLWAFGRAPPSAMAEAVRRLSPAAFATAVCVLFANSAVGALRWREVIRAYEGGPAPSLAFLARAYVVAIFYNTFVPGNIGGDALRAHVTRRAFGHPADAYLTILVERGMGLSGLLLLAGTGILVAAPEWASWGAILVVTAILLFAASVVTPGLAIWLVARLPERLRTRVPGLSRPRRLGPLFVASALSVLSQYLAVLSSHLLVFALSPGVTLGDSMAAIPLAMLSLYVPVSVAGLGVREAAFVALFARAGVSAADATAASLAFMAALMLCGLVGGAVHLLGPLRVAETTDSEPSA